MCLSISFAFFVCTSPIFASIVSIPYLHSDKNTKNEMVFRIMETISTLFLYLHHSVNFYLYCMTGRQFRSDLKATLCGRCIRAGAGPGGKGPAVQAKPHQRAAGTVGKITNVEDTVVSSSADPQTTWESIGDDKSTAIG